MAGGAIVISETNTGSVATVIQGANTNYTVINGQVVNLTGISQDLGTIDNPYDDGPKQYHYTSVQQGWVRPDADGYIDWGDATTWYRFGNGQPLYADVNKLDFGNFSMDRFENSDYEIQGSPAVQIQFAGKDFVNVSQALVYGTVTAVQISNDSFFLMPDTYNFDYKLNGSLKRNVETMAGSLMSGGIGTPFPIYFYGVVKRK